MKQYLTDKNKSAAGTNAATREGYARVTVTRPLVGITIFPEFFQNEPRALDNLARARATAIATSPYVMAPADEKTGGREPPIDAGAGSVRLLDRPIWGRRELFVRTGPSFTPNAALYRGLRYQPAPPNDLTAAHGAVMARVLDEAKARGLKIYLQVQAAIPPGYRVQFGGPEADDQPLLPDGRSLPGRVDKNGSLASPHVRAYGAALIRDLIRAYPMIDGLHIDWPEYPPYSLDSVFFDFSPHAAAAAQRMGVDFTAMRESARRVHARLKGGLKRGDLAAGALEDGFAGLAPLWDFKARLATEMIAEYREAAAGKELVLRSFPPPWTRWSGFDFAAMAPLADEITVKLFTMHWPMMLRGWGEALVAANPGIEDPAPALARLFAIADDGGFPRLTDYRYPEPEEPHAVGARAQAAKIIAARDRAATRVSAMAHGYGPVADFAARFKVAWDASGGKVWVNRYGYLADAKLDAIGAIVGGRS